MMRAEFRAGTLHETTKEMPLRHMFVPGLYARELTIPAGTLIVGKIHRGACFNVVTKGRITVLTEDGIKEIAAPAFFRSEPGVKRVGYAHTDTVWTTMHATLETDPEKLETELACDSYEELGQIEATARVAEISRETT